MNINPIINISSAQVMPAQRYITPRSSASLTRRETDRPCFMLCTLLFDNQVQESIDQHNEQKQHQTDGEQCLSLK